MPPDNYTGPVQPVVVARPVPVGGAQRVRTHLSIVALVLGIILMLGALYTSVQTMRLLNEVNNRLSPTAPADPTGAPLDGQTDCLPGDEECGG